MATAQQLGCNINYAPTLSAAQAATMFGFKYHGCPTPQSIFEYECEYESASIADEGHSLQGIYGFTDT